ncbi:VOC family protein [Nocardia gipuzkoensis]|uniref:VOC family protein n=1 Tax=Nocardia gipuzkoensis TaxID=2749991 RepID=UPI0038CD98A2
MILRHVTVDCSSPFALASFWSAVTGWPMAESDGPDDTWARPSTKTLHEWHTTERPTRDSPQPCATRGRVVGRRRGRGVGRRRPVGVGRAVVHRLGCRWIASHRRRHSCG